jgi:hypothetical protein
LSTLSTFEVRYDCPVVWADTPEIGARLVEDWCWWFARERVETANGLLRAASKFKTAAAESDPSQLVYPTISGRWR